MSAAGLSRIVLASGNAGKLRELTALLEPLGIALVSQKELGISEAEEPHATFVENALAKARHVARASGLPALADDSGIGVRALGGAPGVYSARYAERAGRGQGDAANNALLVDSLRGVADRAAWYYCVLVLVRSADDPCPLLADAAWHGSVRDEARGSQGFGYDPHFLLPDLGLTAAELDPAVKNRISHRAQAMCRLIERLREG